MLHACQPAFEPFLAKEVNSLVLSKGPGWVRTGEIPAADLCFAHYSLKADAELVGGSAKASAQALVDFFLQTSREEVYEGEWPLVVEGSGEPGVGRRANTIEEVFLELLKKRMARVARLAKPGRPAAGPRRGLFAYLTRLEGLVASREAVFGGQRRMADDPQAPSRSYLKAEEAYVALGRGPQEGETVVDLGAAPGGWSYSAAKRGAKVVAVDNGPLKGGALHPLIEHRPEDAFTLAPHAVDWLFCDMVEDPDRVLGLLGLWLERGACRRFVVNLKFGRHDPLPLMRRARALQPLCAELKLRHLFHDREELTLVGQLKS